jgi:hypothetical protein
VLGAGSLDGLAGQNLNVGDQGVFFLIKTDLAWRDGTRPIFELIGVPTDSYFLLGSDQLYHGRFNEKPVSLDQLIGSIASRRETLVNP